MKDLLSGFSLQRSSQMIVCKHWKDYCKYLPTYVVWCATVPPFCATWWRILRDRLRSGES